MQYSSRAVQFTWSTVHMQYSSHAVHFACSSVHMLVVRMYSLYRYFPTVLCSQFTNNAYTVQHLKLVYLKEQYGSR
jgi:hypothetical protein